MKNDEPHNPVAPLVTFVILASATLTVMAGATISPSLPGLLRHFSDDARAPTLVPLILTAPGLAIALSAPVAGLLADRMSKRLLLVWAMILYAAAGSSGLYLDSLTALMAGRLVLGVAVGTIMTVSLALVAERYQGDRRSQMIGWQAAAMSFGGVVFVGLGGTLGELGWRGPFAVYLAPLLLTPFAYWALRGPAPRVAEGHGDVGSLATPPNASPFWSAALPIYALAMFTMLTFYVVPTLAPFVVEGYVGADRAALMTGLAIGVATFAGGLASLGYRRVRRVAGPATIAAASFAAVAFGFALIAAQAGFGSLLVGLTLAGAGTGIAMPNVNFWLFERVAPTMRGRASGGMSSAVFLGQFACGFVGPALIGIGGLSFAYAVMGGLAAGIAVVLSVVAIRTARWRHATA